MMPDETEALIARFTAGTATDADWEAAFAVCWPMSAAVGIASVQNEETFRAWTARDADFRLAIGMGFYLPAADLLRPEGWSLDTVYQDAGCMRATLIRGADFVETKAPTEAHARAAAAIRAATMEKESGNGR